MFHSQLIITLFFPTTSWNTLAWPGKISDQVEMTETQMDQDNQKFLKKLSDDQQQLEDRLDTLQLLVAGFSGRTDIGKAAETANEVRRVTKESSLYNQRERLFELTVTQYDKVGRMHECIQRLRDKELPMFSVSVCVYSTYVYYTCSRLLLAS